MELIQGKKQLLKELKQAFPGVKFSSRSSRFSMGDSINIDYENGPKNSDVEKIANQYQEGSFNGMEDIYEYNDNPKGCTKYISVGRSYSGGLRDMIINKMREMCSPEDYTDNELQTRAYNLLRKSDLKGNCFKVVKTDCQAGFLEDFYKIESEGV